MAPCAKIRDRALVIRRHQRLPRGTLRRTVPPVALGVMAERGLLDGGQREGCEVERMGNSEALHEPALGRLWFRTHLGGFGYGGAATRAVTDQGVALSGAAGARRTRGRGAGCPGPTGTAMVAPARPAGHPAVKRPGAEERSRLRTERRRWVVSSGHIVHLHSRRISGVTDEAHEPGEPRFDEARRSQRERDTYGCCLERGTKRVVRRAGVAAAGVHRGGCGRSHRSR